MRIALSIVTLTLVTALAPGLRAQPSEIRARIDAFVKAISSGSAERFEAMAKANYTPELLARNPDSRPQMVARVHGDFGEMSIAGVEMTTPTHADIAIRSATNPMPLTIAMDFEAAAPFRIARVALNAGGPAGGRGGRGGPPPLPAPPIKADMIDADLSARLDGYLAALARTDDFAGVVLVAKDGRTVFENPFGVADRERGVPMAAGMRF